MRAFSLVVCCLLALSAMSWVRAEEDPAKPKHTPAAAAPRLWARGPVIDDLKKELELTDDQLAKIKDSVAKVQKAFDDKPEVKDAEAAVKKADDDKKAADAKLRILREGDNVLDEFKKAVMDNVPEDKKIKAAQLVHVKGAGKAPADKPKVGDKPADKPADKAPEEGGGMDK